MLSTNSFQNRASRRGSIKSSPGEINHPGLKYGSRLGPAAETLGPRIVES